MFGGGQSIHSFIQTFFFFRLTYLTNYVTIDISATPLNKQGDIKMTKIKYGKEIIIEESFKESLIQLSNLIDRLIKIQTNARDTSEERFDKWDTMYIQIDPLINNLQKALIYALQDFPYITLEKE